MNELKLIDLTRGESSAAAAAPATPAAADVVVVVVVVVWYHVAVKFNCFCYFSLLASLPSG